MLRDSANEVREPPPSRSHTGSPSRRALRSCSAMSMAHFEARNANCSEVAPSSESSTRPSAIASMPSSRGQYRSRKATKMVPAVSPLRLGKITDASPRPVAPSSSTSSRMTFSPASATPRDERMRDRNGMRTCQSR